MTLIALATILAIIITVNGIMTTHRSLRTLDFAVAATVFIAGVALGITL